MADDKHYVPGDFYRISERSGFKIRAGRTRKEWTGRIVGTKEWEPRQPQDLVAGVADDQTVPEPRPRSPDVFVGVGINDAQFYVLENTDGPEGEAVTPTPGNEQALMISDETQFSVYHGSVVTPESL